MMSQRQLHPGDLPIRTVEPASPIPLYHQVETSLREMINNGLLQPADVLPPELELARAYGVGRHTMRMALSRLVADNLIVRKAGRGTVVQARLDRMKFYLDRSFTRQMADMGRRARSRILEASTGTIDSSAPAPLLDKLGAPCFRLARLRFGDSEPIGLQSTTIVIEQCPDLPNFDFNQESLYDVLSREYRLAITEIRHTASAVIADELQAKLLQIKKGDPLLVIKTVAYLDSGEPIEATTSVYRADHYEYNIHDTFGPCG